MMDEGDARARRPPTAGEEFARVRAQTLALVEGLSAEDCMVQSMPDASPVKWHLAHVTWFFETLVLERLLPSLGGVFRPFRAQFRELFNSYYVGVGPFHPRAERGVLSRPSLDEVLAYRRSIDEQIDALLRSPEPSQELHCSVELGLHHEQQHQELILTDLKHHFSRNRLLPVYRPRPLAPHPSGRTDMQFVEFPGGYAQVGHAGQGFAFDNERPQHGVWLTPFAMASRLVSNGEYRSFIEDGGYQRPELWLSDGWDVVCRDKWCAPLYWQGDGTAFTLAGRRPIDPDEPVCHVSYYEADAYARWSGVRLASEQEWERVAQEGAHHIAQAATGEHGTDGTFLEDQRFHPVAARTGPGDGDRRERIRQLFGDVWEWTQSAYLPYPGFHASEGPASEYNAKFMINQMVLRGGSCVTPRSHIRATYRNFFPPSARWQFSGIRLVRES